MHSCCFNCYCDLLLALVFPLKMLRHFYSSLRVVKQSCSYSSYFLLSLVHRRHHPAVFRRHPGSVVDTSRGSFHSRLKPSFFLSLSFYGHLSLPQADFLEF